MLAFAAYVEICMSEKKSPQDWMNDWQAMQKQYWNAWSDTTRQTMGQPPPPSTPWHEGPELWSRMFGDSGKQSDTVERMLGGAKHYMALMQSMLAAAGGKGLGSDPTHAWSEAMRNGFNMPGVDASMFNNPMAGMLQGIRGEGARGFDQLSQSFAPFLAQAKQESLSWLQAPAFGLGREHQEHYQKMLVAFGEYQEAMKQYNALIMKSSARSFEIFESKLAERSEPGRQIDSLRGLYDVWVDAAEEAYAEIALSDEFRKVYGNVVNTQMRVRSQIQAEVERIGTDLGMPTRTELNSVHKRLHDLRREFRDAGGAGAAAEIEALRAEVEQLKRALAAKKSEPALAVVPKPAVKPAPAPKTEAKAPAPTKAAAKSVKAAPAKTAVARRRAAAVAKPRAATKHGGAKFSEAISAMRSTVGGAKKAAKAIVSGKRAVISAKLPGAKA
jgi:polyhydroxyalkanoate synthase subunit PhaE